MDQNYSKDLGISGDCCFREISRCTDQGGRVQEHWFCHKNNSFSWYISHNIGEICPLSRGCVIFRPKKPGQRQPKSGKHVFKYDPFEATLFGNFTILQQLALELKKSRIVDEGVSRSWRLRERIAEKLDISAVTQNDINEFRLEYGRHKARISRNR